MQNIVHVKGPTIFVKFQARACLFGVKKIKICYLIYCIIKLEKITMALRGKFLKIFELRLCAR